MRCLSCHYELSGLTEDRCPECGRGFDPEDARTYRSDAWFEYRCGPVLKCATWCACCPSIAITVSWLLLVIVAWLERNSNNMRTDAGGYVGGFLFIWMVVIIPLSMLGTVVLLCTAMQRAWPGGWAMRKRVLARGLVVTVVGIVLFVTSIFLIWSVLPTVA